MDAGAEHFTQLADKSLTADIKIATWCPTMDLLALSTADGQLCLHRLNWQRLWAVSPESPVTSLCWRPDGKVLACGYEDGYISLLDVENGETMQRGKMVAGVASAIGWVEEQADNVIPEGSLAYQARTARFCQAPVSATPAPGSAPRQVYAQSRADHQQPQWPVLPKRLDMMCVASGSALSIATFGLFPLAGLDVSPVANKPAAQTQVSIVKATMTPDLKQLYLLWYESRQGNSSGHLSLTICDTSTLADRRRELHMLAQMATYTMSLLNGAESSLAGAEQQWNDAMKVMDDKLQAMQRLMQDHGKEDASPRDEFKALLASGSLSPAMHQFLTSTLGESGVKKLSKAVDSAVGSIGNILVDHLQPSLQAAAFKLNELHSLAKCTRQLQPLGLQQEPLAAAQELCERLLVRAESLRMGVCQAGVQYRHFFAWLLRTVRRLNDDNPSAATEAAAIKVDPSNVAAFLHGQFCTDMVGPELKAVTSTEPDPESLLAATELTSPLKTLMTILGNDSPSHASLPSSATIRHMLQHTVQLCTGAFARSPTAISTTIKPLTHLALASKTPFPPAASIWVPTAHVAGLEGEGQPCACFLAQKARGQQHLGLLRVAPTSPSSQQHQPQLHFTMMEACLVTTPSHESIVDFAFYKAGQIALLLKDKSRVSHGGSINCRLVIFPLSDVPFMLLDRYSNGTNQLSQHVFEACLKDGAVCDLPDDMRQRSSTYGQVQGPLAVSGSRGVACVPSGKQRAVVYDLVEDEDEPEVDDSMDNEDE